MFNFQSFFNSKSKIFLTLIPFLILVIFSTIFFVNQNQSSQNKQNSLNFSSSNSQILSNNNPISTNNSQNNNSNQKSLNLNSQNSSNNLDLKPLVADADHDVVVLNECDLAVKYNKIYDIHAKSENSLILEKSEFAFSTTCTQDSKEFEDHKNTIQKIEFYKNDKFSYFKVNQNEQISFFPEYRGEIILGKSIRIDEKIPNRIQYTYAFRYKNKSYMINLFFQDQSNQKIEKYDIEDLNIPVFVKKELQIQFNSLAPNTPSVKLENNSLVNSTNSSASIISSQKTLPKCDALECFTGQIGTQPVVLKKVKNEGAGAGSSYFSGTITYTNAGNTPIPVKWRQINSVDCGTEGIYLCRDITIEQDIPNGGTLRQPIKYNKNFKLIKKTLQIKPKFVN